MQHLAERVLPRKTWLLSQRDDDAQPDHEFECARATLSAPSIGVVIPARNEADQLSDCLACVIEAGTVARRHGHRVEIVVVLDRCTDATAAVAALYPVTVIAIDAGSVGAARAAGADHLLRRGVHWLSFTDADSRVSPQWLLHQLALDADAVCGTVDVHDWWQHPEDLQARHRASYADRDGHRHIHGANLGVAAHAYRDVGGFQPLRTGEDATLVVALINAGYKVSWSCKPRVSTSARLRYWSPGAFESRLQQLLAAVQVESPERGAALPSTSTALH